MAKDFEDVLRQTYKAVLKPGDVAIDVGAHIGSHTFPMAEAVGPNGKVYAFEPLPSCRKHIVKTLSKQFADYRKCVKVFDCAIGAEDTSSEFVIAVDAPAYSGLQTRTYDVPTTLRRIPIKVRTLDSIFIKPLFFGRLRRLDYIKVDAEGGEYHIFQGAQETLDRFRPLVSFEFGANSIAEYKITTADMGTFWFDRNYTIYDINGKPMQSVDMFSESAQKQAVWDYICIPVERPDLDQTVRQVLQNA
ncbi:FkbM family methyltransferase [bacterium]|nr:FkbM family methyltransferase [bacterium]